MTSASETQRSGLTPSCGEEDITQSVNLANKEHGTLFRTVPVDHWRPARARGALKVLSWPEARIVFIYILLGCLWIICSDMALDWLTQVPYGSVGSQTYKGVNFIITTGLLLYLLLRRSFNRWRQAEQKFREIEERFEYAGRATADAIWDWDFVTDTIWVSESFPKLFGATRQEMDPTSFAWAQLIQNIHPEDRDRMVATARETIDGGGKMWAVEYRYRRKDGSYAWIEGHGYVIRDETGQALRAIGCATDVTARKLAEEKLEGSHRQLRALAARLESLREEERRRIAREIHDELGQMLTGLKMDLRWAEKHLARENSKTLNPVLDKIVEAGELASATIASVQRIARELRPDVLDAQAVVDVDTTGAGVLGQAITLLKKRNITFAVSRADRTFRSWLERYHLIQLIDPDRFYPTNRHAALAFRESPENATGN